jgi:hypothetical protein
MELPEELNAFLESTIVHHLIFPLLKFGPECNADKSCSFTDAQCDLEFISDAAGRRMNLNFSRIFKPGLSFFKTIRDDNGKILSKHEKNAIEKLKKFLEKKGNLLSVLSWVRRKSINTRQLP